MLIAGAKGHAIEILEVFHQNNELGSIFFFDDVSEDLDHELFGKFPIITTLEEARCYFIERPEFVLGLGNPYLRKMIADKLTLQGGILTSVISKSASLGHYEILLGTGLNLMQNVMISNCVTIGKGSLINSHSSLHHNVKIGDYCEISPNSVLLGGCSLGDFCSVGSNATILPNIQIGNHATIGAGAVVNKDLPEGAVAVGVPAKVIKFKNIPK